MRAGGAAAATGEQRSRRARRLSGVAGCDQGRQTPHRVAALLVLRRSSSVQSPDEIYGAPLAVRYTRGDAQKLSRAASRCNPSMHVANKTEFAAAQKDGIAVVRACPKADIDN